MGETGPGRNGIWANRASANGTSANGTSANGTWANGTWANETSGGGSNVEHGGALWRRSRPPLPQRTGKGCGEPSRARSRGAQLGRQDRGGGPQRLGRGSDPAKRVGRADISHAPLGAHVGWRSPPCIRVVDTTSMGGRRLTPPRVASAQAGRAGPRSPWARGRMPRAHASNEGERARRHRSASQPGRTAQSLSLFRSHRPDAVVLDKARFVGDDPHEEAGGIGFGFLRIRETVQWCVTEAR